MSAAVVADVDAWLQALLHELVAAHGGRITHLSDDVATVALPRGRLVALFPARGDDVGTLAARAAAVVREKGPKATALVAIGGGDDARTALVAAGPRLRLRRPVERLHLGLDGATWTRGRALVSPAAAAIDATKRRGAPAAIPWPAFMRAIAAIEAERRATVQALDAFDARLAATKPIATALLMVGVLAGFVFELVVGATTSLPILARAGANVGARVADGEWWRALSSIFLHGSSVHAALNAFVLLHLGLFVERLLGTPRFVLLFVATGFTGGVLSALAGPGPMSVGASGALCGLLGGAAALAFRPQGLVPAPVQRALRRAAFVNLALNAVVSLLPRIDVMAHVGGAAAGVLLVGSGALVAGLPRAGEARRPLVEATARFLAIVAALSLVGSVAIALGLGRPWALRDPPAMHRVSAAGTSFDAPKLLGPPTTTTRDDGTIEARVGVPSIDPVAVSVFRARGEWDALVAGERARAVPDARVATPTAEIDVDGRAAVRGTWVDARGLRIERVLVQVDDGAIVVDAIAWDGFPAWDGVPLAVAGSAR